MVSPMEASSRYVIRRRGDNNNNNNNNNNNRSCQYTYLHVCVSICMCMYIDCTLRKSQSKHRKATTNGLAASRWNSRPLGETVAITMRTSTTQISYAMASRTSMMKHMKMQIVTLEAWGIVFPDEQRSGTAQGYRLRNMNGQTDNSDHRQDD